MSVVLEINHLSIIKKNLEKTVLVNDLHFKIMQGQSLVLLGETGSGKSLTALSIMRLLPKDLLVHAESEILLEGHSLLQLPEIKMQAVRGKKIAMIFQDPSSSLNPVMTIGKQIEEAFPKRLWFSKCDLKKSVLSLLAQVEMSNAASIYDAYPHQLSGGMKQRVMIAMALANDPALLIADEATSALDVINQQQILRLLKSLQAQRKMSILLITHDLKIAEKMADTVVIMRAGRLIAQKDPYHQTLFNAKTEEVLQEIPSDTETVLSIRDLSLKLSTKQVLNKVSFDLKAGETVAIIGGSGSGKTTLLKAMMGFLRNIQGEVFLTQPLQMIFQDPLAAMDPHWSIKEILLEGMLSLGIGSSDDEREERLQYLLKEVGLPDTYVTRYPHELSGGQRQRVCIARALAVAPKILICDEPTSSLDHAVQVQILDLLIRLQNELEISYVIVTHDMNVVRAVAHRVIVLQEGSIVEFGAVSEILKNPKHSYTQALIGASSLDL